MTTGNEEKPPQVKSRIPAAPKIRQLYWCDFPKDAQLPEFWKRRPVVIISFRKHTLHGAVTVIPCSTQPQTNNPYAFSLKTTIDGRASWAICDKPYTVAVSRLTPEKGGTPRMPQDEFDAMMRLLLKWLPEVPPEPPAVDPSKTEEPETTEKPSTETPEASPPEAPKE